MKRVVVTGCLAALAAASLIGSASAEEGTGTGTERIAERLAGALAPRLGGAETAAARGARAPTLAAPSDEERAARQQALAERVRRALLAPAKEAGDAGR